MRFYTNQHPFYWGIDLHARSMSVCIFRHDGAILLPRNMQAAPAPFLQAIAPYREGLVVAVACMFPWYWRADLCAHARIALVLGHALSMKAMHGGKAKNDTIDAHKIAGLLRGGLLPQADVYPAQRRATRDLLRRRTHLMRKRAALLAHVHNTNSQYTLPESGQKIADKTNRDGVADRFADPAVHKSIEIDLALITYDDQLLHEVELSLVKAAKQHDAHTLYLRHTVPGIGKILSLVRLYDMHAIARFPTGQDCVSYCRLVKCAKASAGKRWGTSGKKIGNAHLKWAFSAAVALFLRHNPAGQRSVARLEKTHGQGQALPILAHKLARAVYDMLKRTTAFAMEQLLHGSGSRVGEPAASLAMEGSSRDRACATSWLTASLNAKVHLGLISPSPRL